MEDFHTSNTKTTQELIQDIVTKVDTDYYFEDGGFIAEWLKDDLDFLVKKAQVIDFNNLPKKKPNVILRDKDIDDSLFIE